MSTNIRPLRPNRAYGDSKAIEGLSRGMKQVAGTDAVKPARGEGRPQGTTGAARQATAAPTPAIDPAHAELIRKEAVRRKYAIIAQEMLDDPTTGDVTKAFSTALVNGFSKAANDLKLGTPDY